jgi:WD40 repeat protein
MQIGVDMGRRQSSALHLTSRHPVLQITVAAAASFVPTLFALRYPSSLPGLRALSIRTFVTAIILALLSTPQSRAAQDIAGLSEDEVRSLQQRLRDAGCFDGTSDGQVTPALQAAVNACPDQRPVLRIETGTHLARIRRVAVDASCRLAATASDDKTVRLWSLPDGSPIRAQRLPIREGDAGKIYAVAVSPDGALVAAGGTDAWWHPPDRRGHYVYLFDTTHGSSMRRIGPFGDVVLNLAFSADGRRLGVSLDGTQGIRVVDVQTGRELLVDRDFLGPSHSIVFAPDGTTYASGYDGYVRRYNAELRRTAKKPIPGGTQLSGLAVNHLQQRLAVGHADGAAVDILDAATLGQVAKADTHGVSPNHYLSTVAWSADGRKLLAGGSYFKLLNGNWRWFVRSWDARGQHATDLDVGGNSINSLAPCGASVAYAWGTEFGLLSMEGRARPLAQASVADMRGKLAGAFTVSADARRVRFGMNESGADPVVFDITARTISDSPRPTADLHAPILDSLAVSDWRDRSDPKLHGKPIEHYQSELARSLAIRPDRGGFVLGLAYSLRAFSSDGRPRWPQPQPTPSEAWGVNLARNGDLIVVAYGDGTIRWHRWSDGKELLALFVHKGNKRWVAWTPTGYYMASPGAEELIGWHVNRGWEQPADFFPASRFRDRFNRPDIVNLVLETLDESEAVKRANAVTDRKEDTKPLAAKLPPVVRVTSPADDTGFSSNEVSIGYELRSPSGAQVERIEVLLDGRPQQARGAIPIPGDSIKVKLPAKDVEVSLIAWSGDGASEPARVRLIWAGPAARPEQLIERKLYALVVGVSEYVNPSYKLRYAAKDAADFAAALEGQKGGLYRDVYVRLLRDRDVRREAIADGLHWLERQVGPGDVGIVFLAGHGWTDEKQTYWFLPAYSTTEDAHKTGVAQEDLRRTLRNISGKAVVFLDTCHAGQVMARSMDRVINALSAAENGIVVFASSMGNEVSLERTDWQNGAFTKAILEGLEGQANLLGTGEITASLLDAFVAKRVRELTNEGQHPVMTRPGTLPDFPIAIVRTKVASREQVIPVRPPTSPGGETVQVANPVSPPSAAAATLASLTKFMTRDNRDIYGQDISSPEGPIGFAASDINVCAVRCDSMPACKAFSFDRWRGRCYLKNNLATSILDPRSTIAVKKPIELPNVSSSPYQIEILRNRRVVDEPFARRRTSNFQACKAACTDSLNCVAFNFVKQAGNNSDNCEMFRSAKGSANDPATDSGLKYQAR